MNLIRFFNGFFCSDIAIDLGSETTMVYVKGSGLKVKEPTLVALKERYPENIHIQFGTEAKKLIGKTPKGVKVVRPIKKGAIVDITSTEALLEYFMSIVNEGGFFRPSPKVLVAIPSSISEVEKKAVQDAVYNAGARTVTFVEQGMVAALGSGLNIESTTPSCVLDIGGETTEIAVLASSGIIYSKTFDIGSMNIIEAIEDIVVEKYQVKIGYENATRLMKHLGEVRRDLIDQDETIILQGKDIIKNKPAKIEINQADVFKGLFEPISKLLESIDEALSELPAEAVSGLYKNGITLVGGTSQLTGLKELVSDYVGVKTILTEKPDESVIKGCGMILEEDKISFLDNDDY